MGLPRIRANRVKVQRLHLLARPRVAAQEFETGAEAGVVSEAADIDLLSRSFPTILAHQLIQDHLQRNAMEEIIGLTFGHERCGAVL